MYNNYSEKFELLKNKKLSLLENVQYFLNQIEVNFNLNAFNFVNPNILDEALLIQKKIDNGSGGKLAGMVVAVKDNILQKNLKNTCSSKILNNYTAIYDATVIKKLKESDVLFIGRTNCDEFAMGSSNENSCFGPVLNPYNNRCVSGGSSGGSAVAVAANLCDVALGSDTGGSIRQPASFCGVFGIKPSYGLVSRFGLTAFASSFDSIGCFTKNTIDSALLLSEIAGFDPNDSTSVKTEILNYSNAKDKKYKIGIPVEYYKKGLEPEIEIAIKKVIYLLKSAGHEIFEVSLPHTEYSIAAYYILTTAEASSNLARFDGVRYGYRSKESSNLLDQYINSRSEGFGQEVKRRIMLGTFVLSTGYYDAYYKKAQKVRNLIKKDFDKVFENIDIILTPTTPTTAFKIGEKSTDPLQMYLSDVYTTSANLAGIPGLNIPIGFNSQGLPIGAQILSKQFDESNIFNLSTQIECLLK
ncbi:MAG: Asp-tRNA(Asn)/Glu-tRNA(Gln) amidotransferase subunit GatA [bacterium]